MYPLGFMWKFLYCFKRHFNFCGEFVICDLTNEYVYRHAKSNLILIWSLKSQISECHLSLKKGSLTKTETVSLMTNTTGPHLLIFEIPVPLPHLYKIKDPPLPTFVKQWVVLTHPQISSQRLSLTETINGIFAKWKKHCNSAIK